MRLFIAEKPELGRAIAEAINENVKEKQQNYIIKGDNIITWAFGHILELAEPHIYNPSYEKWNLKDLPLNISYPFKRVPKANSKAQLNLILKFIKDSQIKELIHCGDADEEGQILIDEILDYANNTKPVLRCLINDITPKAIQKAMNEMKPNSNFKALSESGFARAEADWLVGMNLTRLYTALNQRNGGSGLVSVGRVQTPILGLIVHRELENKNHKALEYFAISANFAFENIELSSALKLQKEEKITDENLANHIKTSCQNHKALLSITKEAKKEYPPLPYNLLELQAECSKLYGLSPDKVLEITQNLREKHKAISYNRSDCQYLPETIYTQASQIIECLKANFNNEDIGQFRANTGIKSKAFDDTKLSAHYGIIPLQTKFDLNALTQNEKDIYTLIAKRFLMQFYPPCEYESFSFEFIVGEYRFESSKRHNIELGFKAEFEKQLTQNSEPDYNNVLSCKEALCQNVNLSKEKTKPRPLYTMSTLLKDLNQVSKYVSDEKIKKLLLEKDKGKKGESGGIGTPATRSSHITTLIQREYIEVSKDKKQNIKVLPKGFKLIENLPSMLTGVDMTALWFEQQKEIQSANLSRQDFLKGIHTFITDLINENKESHMSVNEAKQKEQIKCPQCNEGFLREINGKFGKFFSCSNYQNGCDFKTKSINGKPDLSPKQETQTSEYQCPECKEGFLIKRESKNKKGVFWYGCSGFSKGCKFICYEKDGKPGLKGCG